MTQQYRVVVTREGSSWLARVPGMRAAQTFARNLPSLERSIREVIALLEDLPDGAESELVLEWDFSALGELAQEAYSLHRERDRVHASLAGLAQRTKHTVNELVREGWSTRDIALLVGTSPGRVSQLQRETARKAPDR